MTLLLSLSAPRMFFSRHRRHHAARPVGDYFGSTRSLGSDGILGACGRGSRVGRHTPVGRSGAGLLPANEEKADPPTSTIAMAIDKDLEALIFPIASQSPSLSFSSTGMWGHWVTTRAPEKQLPKACVCRSAPKNGPSSGGLIRNWGRLG
jgi:hypothetical protein